MKMNLRNKKDKKYVEIFSHEIIFNISCQWRIPVYLNSENLIYFEEKKSTKNYYHATEKCYSLDEACREL